jgi:divalent metal cation (Fe/Co/Zn/Cd) transporter
MTFNSAIKQIDTCRVYSSGPDNWFVEIDIVMDGDMPLWRAHDISQSLQDQIEALPDVDRCFVHVDHEVDHKPVSGGEERMGEDLFKLTQKRAQEHRKHS